jgi:uncharacterized protein (DUF1697 family)
VTRYAVLLRGVNVGGNNKVPMARLRELAEELGYTDVATYVQSGNLVVSAAAKNGAEVERAVADAIRTDLGVDVAVVARNRKELAAVIAANPFGDIADDPKRLLVNFLTAQPAADAIAGLDRDEFLPERFEFGDRCMYQWFPDGVGRSTLATAPWDRRLGVRGTSRNWRTVTTLLEMLDAEVDVKGL